jgi:hypothetical protein
MTNDRRHGSVPYHVNLKVSIACHAITRQIHDLLRVSTELQYFAFLKDGSSSVP